jgi:hypothetical protein
MAQTKKKWLVYKVTKQIYDDNRVVITADKDSAVYRYGVSKKQVVSRYQYTTQYFGSSCEGPGYYRETYIDGVAIEDAREACSYDARYAAGLYGDRSVFSR